MNSAALAVSAAAMMASVGDVVGDGGRQQDRFVGDEGDVAAQVGQGEVFDVDAVDAHHAGPGVEEAGDQ